jgi:hypothetical protein
MKDWMHNTLKWVDYNRTTVTAIALVIALSTGLFTLNGCQSKTIGLLPGTKVNHTELESQVATVQSGYAARAAEIEKSVAVLNADIEASNKQIEIAVTDIKEQDEVRASIVQFIGNTLGSLATGTVDPATLITPLLGIGGLLTAGGVFADNRRKDMIIKGYKSQSTPVTPTA